MSIGKDVMPELLNALSEVSLFGLLQFVGVSLLLFFPAIAFGVALWMNRPDKSVDVSDS